jgi:CRP/FNR family transcriptional regulator, cyclic AMP receptor protein
VRAARRSNAIALRLEPSTSTQPAAFMAAARLGRSQPDMLSGLDAVGRAVVLDQGRPRLFRRGQPVFRQGERHDGIFLIESGLVRVFYTASTGREITLAYWMAGNFCGGPEVFGMGNHVWSGTAVRDTRVQSLSGGALRGLVDRFPALAIGIIETLIFKGVCYSHLAQLLGTRSVTERLSSVLHQLERTYGRPVPEGIEIVMPFTHDDLASMVGATRQWVSMTLGRLADQGVLDKSHRRLVIRRPDLLKKMSDSALESSVAHLA